MSYIILTLDNPLDANGRRKADLPTFQRICAEVLRVLEQLTPVDTGFCKSQWAVDVGEEFATFTCTCPYASYLDRDPGWSKQAPHGMTGPMLKRYLPEIARRLLRDTRTGRFR